MSLLEQRRGEAHIEAALHGILPRLALGHPVELRLTLGSGGVVKIHRTGHTGSQADFLRRVTALQRHAPGGFLLGIISNGHGQSQGVAHAHEERGTRREHHGTIDEQLPGLRTEASTTGIRRAGKHAVGRQRIRHLEVHGKMPVGIRLHPCLPDRDRLKVRAQTRLGSVNPFLDSLAFIILRGVAFVRYTLIILLCYS